MTNDDEKLKYKINSDIHPQISDAFYKKTLESLLLSNNLASINNDGTLLQKNYAGVQESYDIPKSTDISGIPQNIQEVNRIVFFESIEA